MKTFAELSTDLQAKAVELALTDLLTAICEGAIRFNDDLNGDNLQGRIDAAFEKAEAMRTPWFAQEYVMDACADDLRGMAQCSAEDCLYRLPSDPHIVTLAA